jgi:hypothetical protein
MPWKECNKMDERGEKMAPLCRSFGISRKTGYKIFERYKTMGLEGLTDRSRRPYRQANQLPFQLETLIVSLKKEQPSWGAPKIREEGTAELGRAQDPREAHPALSRSSHAGGQYCPCRARPSRPGQAPQETAP